MSAQTLLKVSDVSVQDRLMEGLLQVDDLLLGTTASVQSGNRGGCEMRYKSGDHALVSLYLSEIRRTGQPVDFSSSSLEYILHGDQHDSGGCQNSQRLARATLKRVRVEYVNDRPTAVTTISTISLGRVCSSSQSEHNAISASTKHETITEREAPDGSGQTAKTETSSHRMLRTPEELDAVLKEIVALASRA